jgi:hypothetical protein
VIALLVWPVVNTQAVFATDRMVASATTRSLPELAGQVRYDGVLIAQASPTTAQAEEAILALFDASEPVTVEEEVAKAHGLAIISRLILEALGKRVVRFRVPDARSAMAIVAELRADSRVSGAQLNFRYRNPTSDRGARVIGLRRHLEGEVKREKRVAARQRLNDGRTGTKVFAMQRRESLVAGNQASLRWPSAAEPFVNVGTRNR